MNNQQTLLGLSEIWQIKPPESVLCHNNNNNNANYICNSLEKKNPDLCQATANTKALGKTYHMVIAFDKYIFIVVLLYKIGFLNHYNFL